MYFIGNFVHSTNQEEVMEVDRRHGEFSLVIDADTPVAALKKFRDKIVNYRATSDFFQGDCSIYLIQLFEFDMFPVEEAMMLNYESTAGDPLMPFIRCSLPSDMTESCRLFDWENNAPEVDGEKEKLFVAFEAGSARVLFGPEDTYKLTEQT